MNLFFQYHVEGRERGCTHFAQMTKTLGFEIEKLEL